MASVFKATKDAETNTILYYDANGKRRKKAGYTDKRTSQGVATKLEREAREIKDGMADRKAIVCGAMASDRYASTSLIGGPA
jgi:hypothetical protein